MAIRPRGNSFQIDVQVNGKRARATAETLQEARVIEAQLKADLMAGREPLVPNRRATAATPKSASFTLEAAFEATYDRYWRGTANEKTALINGRDVVTTLGADTDLRTIGTAQVDGAIRVWRDRGLKDGTINRKLAALSKILTHHSRLYPDVVRKPHIEFLKEPQGRIRYFSDQERAAIVQYFLDQGEQDWADFFTLLIDGGMRASELREAEARNLDGSRLRLWKTKADLPRTVPLTNRAREAFERQVHRHGGQPFGWASKNAIRHAWEGMKGHLRLTHDAEFVPHACRHDAATRLLRLTRNLVLVQKWLGHKDINMTLRYAHLIPEDLEEARDLLEKAA